MKKFRILSILFFLFSLAGAVFLVKNEQDTRNKAASGDKCTGGKEVCQENKQGKNTGFLCKCLEILDPNDWQCTTKDTKKCPTDSGDTDPGAGTCGGGVGVIQGRCIKAVSGKSLPQMWKYKCPGKKDLSGGCQENEQVVPAGSSSVCFDSNYCGVQQIDSDVWSDCFISVVDTAGCDTKPTTPPNTPTNTPTPTVKPTNTPTPTVTPRATSTPKLTATPTPTNTPTPTPGPTSTPGPSSTPTPAPPNSCGGTCGSNTNCGSDLFCHDGYCRNASCPDQTNCICQQSPTSTPVPTEYIAEGPSPTRIILPQSGVEFPSQMLTIFGGIVTLLGFLILL
jgi:hypothetical protein